MVAVAGFLAAVAFVWLGMVLAISFLEAPLKFRAPGVTLPLGLGIGRIVFRALHRIELAALALLALALLVGPQPPGVVAGVLGLLLVLGVQLGVVNPRLRRRSDRVLAGEPAPRSRAHLAYVGLEALKVVLLLATGVAALAAG